MYDERNLKPVPEFPRLTLNLDFSPRSFEMSIWKRKKRKNEPKNKSNQMLELKELQEIKVVQLHD